MPAEHEKGGHRSRMQGHQNDDDGPIRSFVVVDTNNFAAHEVSSNFRYTPNLAGIWLLLCKTCVISGASGIAAGCFPLGSYFGKSTQSTKELRERIYPNAYGVQDRCACCRPNWYPPFAPRPG